MGGNRSVVKWQGAVGGLASKLGHCGHGMRQRTSHTPGARPLQHSTSEENIRSAGRSQGAASKKINRERHPGNGTQVIEHGHREERREGGRVVAWRRLRSPGDQAQVTHPSHCPCLRGALNSETRGGEERSAWLQLASS